MESTAADQDGDVGSLVAGDRHVMLHLAHILVRKRRKYPVIWRLRPNANSGEYGGFLGGVFYGDLPPWEAEPVDEKVDRSAVPLL